MPVYQSTLDLILDIKKRSREPVLESPQIDAVAAALAGAKPYGSRDWGNATDARGGETAHAPQPSLPSLGLPRGPLVLAERPVADRGTPARRVIGVAEPAFPEDDN